MLRPVFHGGRGGAWEARLSVELMRVNISIRSLNVFCVIYSHSEWVIVQVEFRRYVTGKKTGQEIMSHKSLSVAGALALLVAPMYAQTGAPKLLPGTKPNVLSSITGKAVTSTNAPMGSTLIRLRDVRFGRVVATTITDKAGQFEFKGVDVGSYIVEMMTPSS